MASLVMGALLEGSRTPTESNRTTLPWRATRSTAPGITPLSMSLLIAAMTRPRRSEESPTASGFAVGRLCACAGVMETKHSSTVSHRVRDRIALLRWMVGDMAALSEPSNPPSVRVAEEMAVYLGRGGEIAGIEIGDPSLHPLVQARQGVKGYGGIGVVLSVIRHVPREQADQSHREGRPCVVETIGGEGTGGVLREQIRPEESLAHEPRQNPHEEQHGRAREHGEQGERNVEREIDPCLEDQRAALPGRHPRTVGPPRGEAEDVPDAAQTVRDAREHEEVGAQGGGLGKEELGIARGVLRVAVMLPVEHAIVTIRPEGEEARHRTHDHVEPAVAEGGTVGCLVKRAEEEGQHVAVSDQDGNHPQRGAEHPYQRPRSHEEAEMPEGAGHRRPIGADHEGAETLAAKLVRGESNQRVVAHPSLIG